MVEDNKIEDKIIKFKEFIENIDAELERGLYLSRSNFKNLYNEVIYDLKIQSEHTS
jgi:hypothetical protein